MGEIINYKKLEITDVDDAFKKTVKKKKGGWASGYSFYLCCFTLLLF